MHTPPARPVHRRRHPPRRRSSVDGTNLGPGASPPRLPLLRSCRNVVSTDSRQADLYDLLSHSVRETQYSFTPAGAPRRDGSSLFPMSCCAHQPACLDMQCVWFLPLQRITTRLHPAAARCPACRRLAVPGAPAVAGAGGDAGHGAGALQCVPGGGWWVCVKTAHASGGLAAGRQDSRRLAYLLVKQSAAVVWCRLLWWCCLSPLLHPTFAPTTQTSAQNSSKRLLPSYTAARPWPSAACSRRSSVPGPAWTTPSSSGASTSGARQDGAGTRAALVACCWAAGAA